MNNESMLGLQTWGRCYRPPPLKGDSGLQLMPSVGARMTVPFLPDGLGGSYSRRESGIPNSFPSQRCLLPPKGLPELSAMAMDICYHNNGENGKIHFFSGSYHHHSNTYGALLLEGPAASSGTNSHTLQMLQPTMEISKAAKAEVINDLVVPQTDIVPLKKRSKGHAGSTKDTKPKQAKKAIAQREEAGCSSGKRRRTANKSLDMVINGIDLDLSGIPSPLCTCTGHPKQCYKWGAGGWQSACCTTSISMYPLPMSSKRKGARIAGRKMSQGAFKKVLEKLAGEGQDFSIPIDLRPFWAKHGTNKFVTIR